MKIQDDGSKMLDFSIFIFIFILSILGQEYFWRYIGVHNIMNDTNSKLNTCNVNKGHLIFSDCDK